MRLEMPHFTPEKENPPPSLLEHLDLVDRVDDAFDAYMKAIRTYKKETKGLPGDDPKWHELASHTNMLEADYKALREASKESYAKLSASDQELFLESHAATKKGRIKVREELERSASPEIELLKDVESTTEIEPSSPESSPKNTELETPPGLAQEILEPKFIRVPEPAPRPDLVALEMRHREESLTPAPTFLERIRASRLKTLGASLIALFTSGGVVKAVEHVAHEMHEVSEAKDRVQVTALQSTFDFMNEAGREVVQEALPDESELITINNVELPREEAANEINAWYTNLLTEARIPMSTLLENCETQLPNGDLTLDAIKCDLLYGNQIGLNARAQETLSTLADLTLPEYKFTSEVLRDSVYHRPTGFTVSEGFSVMSLSTHDAESIPQTFHENREDLYDMYYNDAYALIRATLDDIDIESYTAPEREHLKDALQTAIEKEIELSNQMIIVSSLLTNIDNEYSEASLKAGLKDVQTEEMSTAQMDHAMTNVTEADTAWEKVAQVTGTEDSQMLAKQLKIAHHGKFESIANTGQDIDTDDTGFYEQAREWSVRTSI